jgi:hypothetical protein
VKILEEVYRAQIVVKGETWDTLWLIQKTITEGQKRELPFRIEIKGASVDTTISLAANVATIGVAVYNIIEYLRKKRKEEKSLEITKFSRDMAYAYVSHQLKTVAEVPEVELTSEHRTSDGGYHFEFKDKHLKDGILVVRHIYTISRDFDVKYDRKEDFILR